jgi:hypothetical protein
MRVHHILAVLPGLLAVPLWAQPQIGGGVCASSSLSGSYTSVLTGRDVSSTVAFTNATQSIGTVTFDGLSKVTFTLTNSTNKASGTAQTLSGTYSIQANCLGVITISSGGAQTFTVESYNTGKDYLLTGQDATFAYTGSGSLLPTTCPTSFPAGMYAVSASGWGLTSSTISSVFNLVGFITISGTNSISLSGYVASNSGAKPVAESGTFTVASNCSGAATLTDSSGNSYVLTFEFTTSAGKNFSFQSTSPVSFYSGSGGSL